LRVGDDFAFDPRTLHPLEDPDADDRTVDEVAGFSVRLAAESGAHELEQTDCRVTRSMALNMAKSKDRLERLMGYLVAARVWEPDGTGWKLIGDPKYLHLLSQDEIDRARIRGKDANNPRLWVRALLRDGDNCRACGRRVNWSDRKSQAGGTWEHVNIGNQPTQPDEYVVYCMGCQNDPMAELMPPPATPFYSEKTRKRITGALGKWPKQATIKEYVSGQRTLPGPASTSQRSEKEDAADGLRTLSEDATDGLRPSDEDAAEIATQRPEDASGNAGEPPATESPPGASQAPPGAEKTDLQIPGIENLDIPGRVGTGGVLPSLDSPDRSAPVKPAHNRSRRARSTKPKEQP
jgi:hypothetical protein